MVSPFDNLNPIIATIFFAPENWFNLFLLSFGEICQTAFRDCKCTQQLCKWGISDSHVQSRRFFWSNSHLSAGNTMQVKS